MFFNFFDGTTHLFWGSFDEEKKALDIKIAHDFYVENLVYQLYAFNLNVSATVNYPVVFVSQKSFQELNRLKGTQFMMIVSPSDLYSVSMILETVRACSCDLNSYICTATKLIWIHNAKYSRSSTVKMPSLSLSHTKRIPKCLKSKG